MRDFPFFDTEFGVASLVLKEIPYRGEAYITLRDSLEPEKLLAECVAFCRICGAEKIFATGASMPEGYPLHTILLEMRGPVRTDGACDHLFPVTESTVARWRQIYNERMRPVDNGATMETRDEARILSSGGAYFIHREGELLGIGWLEGSKLLAVAAVKPGAGERVLRTLMSAVPEETMTLEVASTNQRAIRFYERMGFLPVREISRWHSI